MEVGSSSLSVEFPIYVLIPDPQLRFQKGAI